MPSLCGKQFSQNTALDTISTISLCGNISKGSVFTITLVLSFAVLMYHSTSGTCSSLLVMFTSMLCNSIGCLIHLNCWSLSICLILNLHPQYVSMICCMDFIIIDLVLFFIISAVLNCIALDPVIMEIISSICILSMAKVM